jgi:thiamine-phosphate pyrophosphorylase
VTIHKSDMLLYAVTDRTWLGEKKLVTQVEEVLKAGVTLLQFREKSLRQDEFIKQAKEINELAVRYHIPLIINDNVEATVAVDAAGVHLGQEDENILSVRAKLGPDKIIGCSAHSVEEAIAAQTKGADYIGVGAVFGSGTKQDAKPISKDTLTAICQSVTIPVVAIGGINKENIMKLAGTGVDGVAVISAIFAEQDITEATRELLQLAKKMTNRDYSSHERVGEMNDE